MTKRTSSTSIEAIEGLPPGAKRTSSTSIEAIEGLPPGAKRTSSVWLEVIAVDPGPPPSAGMAGWGFIPIA